VKQIGCCSQCGQEVFEISRRNPDTGAPINVGAPLGNAMKATFVLFNGSQMDLTMCESCVDALEPSHFAGLWRKVMDAWIAQSGADHPWPRSQVDNGIVGLLYARPWKAANG
jgi:hypothetical protein